MKTKMVFFGVENLPTANPIQQGYYLSDVDRVTTEEIAKQMVAFSFLTFQMGT